MLLLAANFPMASILQAYELFGGEGFLYAAVCVVAYLVSGHVSLYTAQEFYP